MADDRVLHILLVEDELGLRVTLTDRLRNEGYAVESAADGDAGYKRALAEPFDLIILDIMLPRKSGNFCAFAHLLSPSGLSLSKPLGSAGAARIR